MNDAPEASNSVIPRSAYLAAGLVAGMLVFWLASSPRTVAQTSTAEANAMAAYQRSLDEQAERMKRYAAILQLQEDLHKRAEALVDVQEHFMKRQAVNADRMDKILDTWEQQQKQYQRYLDTVAK